MNKYQFKTKWGLGTAFYYCYGDNRFENYLILKNIKYKKLEETDDSGFNEFNEIDKEIERLNKGLEYIELYWSNREEYEKNELLRQIRDKDTNIEWLERAIEEEKKRERLH